MESKLEDGQCGFRPGRSTTDQIFTLKQIFEKSWEYGKDLFACLVDLEKAYDRVPRDELWKVLQNMAVMVNCYALLSCGDSGVLCVYCHVTNFSLSRFGFRRCLSDSAY